MSTEMNDRVIDKVRKLLRLGESSNEHEAAAAMAAANRLIQQHRLDMAQVEVNTGVAQEEVFADISSPIVSGERVAGWKVRLLAHLSRHNGCTPLSRTAEKGRAFFLVGRPSDVETVRHLYNFAVSELTRLSQTSYSRGSWLHGAVSGINERMQEAKAAQIKTATTQAIVCLDQRLAQADAFVDKEFHTRTRKVSTKKNMDWDAYNRGKVAGKNMNLGAKALT